MNSTDTGTTPASMSDRLLAEPEILCEDLVKMYKIGTREVIALQGLDLRVAPGEMVGIVGKSGSGKSTLLSILGGYALPSAGKVRVAGFDMRNLSGAAMTRYRRHAVGFVWQQTGRNLLPFLTALQNVEQPICLAGAEARAARSRAGDLLGLVGLSDRLRHKPADLSGGEQQRVAIAVALANNPRILLADEPTGELDSRTAQEILRVLQAARQQIGVTVVVVTHDASVGAVADRLVAIRDGRVGSEQVRVETSGTPNPAPEGKHREYAVVDRAGRLQIPPDYLRTAGITDRAVLSMEGSRIVIESISTPETPVG